MRRAIAYLFQVASLAFQIRVYWLLWRYEDWCYRNASIHTGNSACTRDCLQSAQEMCSEVFELRMKRQRLGLLHAMNSELYIKRQRSALLHFLREAS